MAKTFRVPHRVYSEPDAFGHRQLLASQGAQIAFEEAEALGLTERGAVDVRELPFVIPHHLYRHEDDGSKILTHRAGTVITLGEAAELGLVDGGEDPDGGEERREEGTEDGDPDGTAENGDAGGEAANDDGKPAGGDDGKEELKSEADTATEESRPSRTTKARTAKDPDPA